MENQDLCLSMHVKLFIDNRFSLFSGHCSKAVVVITAETKGSVHLVGHGDSYFSYSAATCLHQHRCNLWG